MLGGALVGVLAFAVAAPMAVAARYSYEQASLVDNVFKSETQTKSATRPNIDVRPTQPNGQPQPDPWETKPRLNILLLGGDAGREPGRHPDRHDHPGQHRHQDREHDPLQPAAQHGQHAVPADVAAAPLLPERVHQRRQPGPGALPQRDVRGRARETVPKDILGPTDNLGADALKLSVGEALGLTVDYYVLINLRGFETLVDALGGITVNVNSYVPIGGVSEENRNIPPSDYIEPGPNQKLDGQQALWFARGRYGSDDFARMGRQRCVVNAIIDQANPANMLARYEQIAKAGKKIVITDIPQEVLPLLVDLSLRVKNGQTRSVLFQQGVANFRSFNPDFPAMRKLVRETLKESSRGQVLRVRQSVPVTVGQEEEEARQPSPSATPQSAELDDTCAFDPEKARTATRPS